MGFGICVWLIVVLKYDWYRLIVLFGVVIYLVLVFVYYDVWLCVGCGMFVVVWLCFILSLIMLFYYEWEIMVVWGICDEMMDVDGCCIVCVWCMCWVVVGCDF